MENDGVVGLLSFLSFGFSVIAAVLAIDTYALLRTGQSGSTWRVLIIASVIFALMHALRLAEVLDFSALSTLHLSEVVELIFVMALAYAFYLQRRIFQGKTGRSTRRSTHNKSSKKPDVLVDVDITDDESDSDEDNEEKFSSHEWERLNGLPTSGFDSSRSGDDADEGSERRRVERRSAERRRVS